MKKKKKKIRDEGSFALKLNMSKTYNRLKCALINVMLRRMSFSKLWVQKIMRCIEMISYSVVMSGEVGNLFLPYRGLKQGGPLNPYLFLFLGKVCHLFLEWLLQVGISRVLALRDTLQLSPTCYLCK